MFALEPSFNVDQDDLKTRYFELSKKHHPDRADSYSSMLSIEEINKAYNTLRSDLSRARYLNGPSVSGVDRDFLASVLDYEEAISSMENNEDRERIRTDLEEKITECKLKFFDKEHLCKWGYYEKLRDLLNRKRHGLEE